MKKPILSEDDTGAQFYRDAWAFLREAEVSLGEGRDKAALSLARAAVFYAMFAAEDFLERVISQMGMDPNVKIAVDDAITRVRKDVLGNKRLADEWEKLFGVWETIVKLLESSRENHGFRFAQGFLGELRKRMLDLALENCRENLHDKRFGKRLDSLLKLRARLGKETLDSGSLVKRWLEGTTGICVTNTEDSPVTGDFRQIVMKARKTSVTGVAQDITVEEARLACGAVRSMIASVCGSANREVPQWVKEIHGRIF